jgi:hypothetical protein
MQHSMVQVFWYLKRLCSFLGFVCSMKQVPFIIFVIDYYLLITVTTQPLFVTVFSKK